jgi:hypothetical protein
MEGHGKQTNTKYKTGRLATSQPIGGKMNQKHKPTVNPREEERQRERKFTEVLETNDYQVVELNSHTWIFNDNILQYSTMTYRDVNNPNQLYVDSVVLSLDSKLEKNPYLRCVLFWNEMDFMTASPAKITVQDSYGGVKIYHVAFRFSLDRGKIPEDYSASVVDSLTFVQKMKNQKNMRKNSTEVFAHVPIVYDPAKRPPKTGVINCVHLIRDMNITLYKRTKTWIRMFQALGVDKIRFYSIDEPRVHLQKLRYDNPDFIDIINYEHNVVALCAQLSANNSESCAKTYGHIFDFKKVFNLHERLVTNDCLIHSRFTHSFMTNMDVDELIRKWFFTFQF